jgi:O-antigen/teichoic acid export membrane protein
MIVVISLVAAYGIASILTLTLALRGTKASPVSDMSQPTVRESYGFALRSVLGSVFPVDAFSLDQLVVGLVLSPAALGYYVVATAFTNVPRFIGQSLGMVGYPTVAAKREPAFAMRTVWRFALASVVLGGAVVIALEVVMGWVVPFFFGSAFIHSVETARILLVASFFVSVRRVLGDCVRGAGMPSLGSIAEASSWFVAGPAIVLLVPRGINGVAVAMAISYGFSLGILIAGIALHRWRTGPSSQVIVGTAANDRGIGP